MSRSLQTASLSDNVVNIPIRLYTARRLGPYRFHLLHQKDGSRVRQHLLRRTLNPVKTLLHALLVVMLISCSRIPVASTQPVRIDGAIDGRRIEHVVIIAIDGLKRDTLLQYLMTSPPRREGGLHDLLGAKQDGDGLVLTKGVSVKEAVTVFPSYTYPSWTSMFTGVFPGVHGITGNSVFFRDRKVARYYAEYHLDALRAQMEKDFLSNDINPNTKTIYEYVGEQGGQSIVVHNMVSRGAEARKPDFDTLWNYQRNHSKKVDENSLWATIKSLEEFNKDDPAEQRLPTVLTMYFSGLDHAEHMLSTDPEKARLAYLKDIDDLIAKFIVGDTAIARNHFPTPESDSIQTDFISWSGLQKNPAWPRTLVILVSDHGHTPIKWNDALGMEDLKLMVKELNKKNGRTYNLEDPTLIDESLWSKIRAGVGFFVPDGVSPLSNIVATFNGGALGLHIKPAEGSWKQRPDYTTDIVPVLEHVLLTLHRNDQEPEAVLYNTGNRYVSVPYESTRSAVRVLPPVELEQSPLTGSAYPMAVERLTGLASRLPTDPLSAPDIILLADRSKGLTYSNKQDWRVIEQINIETHRHFHSDHGHLNASDSLVPMIFLLGGYAGQEPLPTICQATIVDIAPTVLDMLGIAQSFEQALGIYPEEVKGHSLKKSMEHVLQGSAQDENICSARMTTSPDAPVPEKSTIIRLNSTQMP